MDIILMFIIVISFGLVLGLPHIAVSSTVKRGDEIYYYAGSFIAGIIMIICVIIANYLHV